MLPLKLGPGDEEIFLTSEMGFGLLNKKKKNELS